MFSKETAGDSVPLLMLLPMMHKLVISSSFSKDSGYTKTQFIIFAALSLRESLTMSQVAGFIASSKEQATRAVAPLVDGGYAERYTDPENRTKIRIRLTDAGRAFVEEWQRRLRANLSETFKTVLTDKDRAELDDAIACMIRILGKIV